MIYKCLIVDDEELARELIETHLSQLDNFETVASCASAMEAHKVLQAETIDLLFLDIEMPVLKGTDFFKNLINKPKVIFTTAYREYAVEGFELHAVDYLLKPIVFVRFFKAIEKFIESVKPQLPAGVEASTEPAHLYVQSNKKRIKVLFDHIYHVESIKDYIKIHLENATVLMVKHGITAFEKKLDGRFLRVHRSYIVNRQKITAYTKQDVEIENVEIPIGDFYRKDVLAELD
ncbi:MAG: response regulator transcription factor [Roseivirga sp.]|nr:response regulator transcription factor [Roseivirga sp.]